MTTKLQMHCKECGSTRVMRDAWASWNYQKQEWELSQSFDHAFCEDCEGETKIIGKEVLT